MVDLAKLTVKVCCTLTVRTTSRSGGIAVAGPPGTVHPLVYLEAVGFAIENYECAPTESVKSSPNLRTVGAPSLVTSVVATSISSR